MYRRCYTAGREEITSKTFIAAHLKFLQILRLSETENPQQITMWESERIATSSIYGSCSWKVSRGFYQLRRVKHRNLREAPPHASASSQTNTRGSSISDCLCSSISKSVKLSSTFSCFCNAWEMKPAYLIISLYRCIFCSGSLTLKNSLQLDDFKGFMLCCSCYHIFTPPKIYMILKRP